MTRRVFLGSFASLAAVPRSFAQTEPPIPVSRIKRFVPVLIEKGRSRLGRCYRYAMRFLALVLGVFALLFVREGLRYVGLF